MDSETTSGTGGDEGDDPGVTEAIGGARAAFMRMLNAHIGLLKAELAETGQQLGVIIGLALAALGVAILVAILLYVGIFLFLGEWLFGSMGWGMVHGTLFGVGLIIAVAVNLAGGRVVSYAWGALWGLIIGLGLFVVLWLNLPHEGAKTAVSEVLGDVDIERNLLILLVGIVVGGVVVAVGALIAGWRNEWRFGSPAALLIGGFAIGGFFGAILGPVFWSYRVAGGVALMVGLLAWIIIGLLLAYRHGFDPEARYAGLIPRESIAAFESSREFMEEQWERQKGKLMGR